MRENLMRPKSASHDDTHQDIGDLVRSALWMWGRSRPRRMVFFLRVAWRMWRANRLHVRRQRETEGPIPTVVAISPTMRCNYSCAGCYSRGRPTKDELSTEELDVLLTEAERLGVLAIVVTGGEPLLREDMLDLVSRHRRLLFVMITNGSFVTPETAQRIAKNSNLISLVSIDGLPQDTDEMRRPGAHDIALRALQSLREARACYGFAATCTWGNIDHLGSDLFVNQMVELGCSVGYFTEYVPCGPDPPPDWALSEEQRAAFRQRVLDLRRRKRIVLIQFPHDEYGPDNRCSAAGRQSLHINSQGDVEPCPFVPIARENVRNGGLLAACQSPFLRAIREHPHLLQRGRYACALWEHREEVEGLVGGVGGDLG
jgi:MoaA/NifB/PqqE/SkfB family radical SAM enzyme